MAEESIAVDSDNFPFLAHIEPRPGQIDMIRECRESLRKSGHHLAAAPTGIGKTAASLAAALEIARKSPSKLNILFLTGRQSQHKIVIDTVRKINSRIGSDQRDVKIVDIIGRESMCEVVDIQTGRCLCEKGSSDSAKSRLREDVRDFILEHPRHVEEIISKSKIWGVCAWQTCRTAAKDSEILVCDYNHIFSEQVRESSLPSMGITLNNSILIVDEAHNLPDRIRMSMERIITPTIIRNSVFELEEYMGDLENSAMRNSSKSTIETLEGVQWAFEIMKLTRTKMAEYFRKLHEKGTEDEELLVEINEFVKIFHTSCDEIEGISGQLKIDGDTPQKFVTTKDNRLTTLAEVLRKVKEIDVDSEEEDSEPDSFRIAHILESIIAFGSSTALCMVFSPKGKEGKITIHLLDPGVLSGPIFEQCGGSILMSGTLYPPTMYADMLALPRNKTTKTAYESPFAGERRPVLIAKNVTTKYNERSEHMWNRMRNHIQSLINGSNGHVAVFCPSYKLMSEIIGDTFFKGVTKIVESRDWSKDDIDKVVGKLKKARSDDKRIMLCGVFGARLSEGIDYDDGILSSVICIGIPNPPPSVLSNSLKQYISDKFGKENSWRYTVTQPAINSILQAMGRPIRSVEDRALILLLDKRSGDRMYYSCYPKDLKMNSTNDPKTTLSFASRFFKKIKRS